jgi:hypothetical protein
LPIAFTKEAGTSCSWPDAVLVLVLEAVGSDDGTAEAGRGHVPLLRISCPSRSMSLKWHNIEAEVELVEMGQCELAEGKGIPA